MLISINRNSNEKFKVKITSDNITNHIIFLSDETHKKMTNNLKSKEDLINFSITFLLKREPNTAILSSFDLTKISHYFPEYLDEVKSWINE